MNANNKARLEADLNRLIELGDNLLRALQDNQPFGGTRTSSQKNGDRGETTETQPPTDFNSSYQIWYSEAARVIRQLLPDRIQDFTKLYERPRGRKSVSSEYDCVEDYLLGSLDDIIINGNDIRTAASCAMQQQIAMLKAATQRFSSSLFDIAYMVQADLFESELDAARALKKSGLFRAAGAMAGVVLERHLLQVCTDNSVAIPKKNPGISVLIRALKDAEIIGLPEFRYIEYLADIRNICGHPKEREPTADDIDSLISGTNKVIKTVL